jgi:hypothetical protein
MSPLSTVVTAHAKTLGQAEAWHIQVVTETQLVPLNCREEKVIVQGDLMWGFVSQGQGSRFSSTYNGKPSEGSWW